MQKVVARYQDGRMVKGVSMDVDALRPTFHVKPPEGKAVQVALDELKALFFVRTLVGDSTHKEDRTPNPADPRARGSSIVTVRFADGEEIVGLINGYPPKRPYFFIVPVDPKSNNVRILINRAAVVSMAATTNGSTSHSASA
ncbi:MAG: DUF6982 domain-containing protein [Longimicrobiales bacterium]